MTALSLPFMLLRSPYPQLPAAAAFLHRRGLRRCMRTSVCTLSPSHAVHDGAGYGLVINVDDVGDTSDRGLPVELGLTRTLPAAITADEGFERLKKAFLELKDKAPCASSGVLRYQVAVPPSMKALGWICHMCRIKQSFPLFYSSRADSVEQSVISCGLGATVLLHGTCYNNAKGFSILARYLPAEAPSVTAYGSMDASDTKYLSFMDGESASFFFFIPQFELCEFDGYSVLASTIVWDDLYFHTFEGSMQLLESEFAKMNNYPEFSKIHSNQFWMNYFTGTELVAVTGKTSLMHLNAEVHSITITEDMQMGKVATSYQSFVCFSLQHVIAVDEHLNSQRKNLCLKECSNINLVWTTLMIEELVRLGLTFFCIAPGSRSSPLAIAATTHQLTNCISCYDERSIGFHALGYAKASHKPAVVITSSGTAVSNLLPAVVEAFQDFVPLVLLTADRPPELHNAGANQTIDQVNHFGKFVKSFFSLPPPTDQISARMVLTTVDSALHIATQEPQGPVHINCAFRDPLEDSRKDWEPDCLTGLEKWSATWKPYTSYIRIQNLPTPSTYSPTVMEVLETICRADKGLLIFGSIQLEDDIWAAALLAQQLSWPAFADILSGLRLRRALTLFPESGQPYIFVDHLDHMLLSTEVKTWIKPDVIVQIGSRITSKRIGELLESCTPLSYILVAEHQYRHDPSHVITHRIQSSVTEFALALSKCHLPKKETRWEHILQMMNSAVLQEISFQLHSERSLTEPFVAHAIGERLGPDSAIFVGNSMVIRDIDMYGKGWTYSLKNCPNMLASNLVHGVHVTGNRGASGIDGLLSTAVGYAAGSFKRVFCIIGDISFLHDTNGLSLLNQRVKRKPITLIIVNNHGGAIFNFLPISRTTEPDILKQFFYTEHDISISKLCEAHRVKHFLAQTKRDFCDALDKAQVEQMDCLIEVKSSIDDNAKFHKLIRSSCHQVANQTFNFLQRSCYLINSNGLSIGRISLAKFMLYSIKLSAPRTSAQTKKDVLLNQGYIIKLWIDDTSIGFGEVAPIELHKEDLLDAEEQLRFLFYKITDSKVDIRLPLSKWSLSVWMWETLGVPPQSIFPSVRCSLEMAMLHALADQHGSCLVEAFSGFLPIPSHVQSVSDINNTSGSIEICALVDCDGSPTDVACVVAKLVNEGFRTLKLKVARRTSPIEDVAVIKKIRDAVGYEVNIRVDANQRWTYDEAMIFSSQVKSFNLQYIEEPVNSEGDIIKFCDQSGLPVALDETICILQGDIIQELHKFDHPAIVAFIIKPSVLGGFENASMIAKWAQMHDKKAIISGAFESSISLATYVQFAYYIDQQDIHCSSLRGKASTEPLAHGLGTYQWLEEDLGEERLKIRAPPMSDRIEASVQDSHRFLQQLHIKNERVQRVYTDEPVKSYSLEVAGDGFSCVFNLQETSSENNKNVVVFLHGFLGTREDWTPFMKALSHNARTIAVDLPGHGGSQLKFPADQNPEHECSITVEVTAHLISQLIREISTEMVLLVGYSMGGRIALHMALNHSHNIMGAVVIAGSPGIRDEVSRMIRLKQDEAKSWFLLSHGLRCFLETWYRGKLWQSLREHPQYSTVLSRRSKHRDIKSLAKVLRESSVGKQIPLWDDLNRLDKPLLLVVGEKDTKFKEIATTMRSEIKGREHDLAVIPDSGHAVHLENPLPVISAISRFLRKLQHPAE